MAGLNRMFGWTMNAFIFITVVLPTGSIYGINFKLPIYACLLPLAVYSMFRRGLASPGRISMMIGASCLLAPWVIVGVAHGFPAINAVRHYTGILMTLLMCWLAFVYAADEDAGRLRFLRLALNAAVVTALFKMGMIGYAFARGIPTTEVVTAIDDVFGVQLMTMDLGALFGRVQFVSDALIPVVIFIILRHRDRLHLSHLRASLTILLLMTSVVFSFSRYFWGFTAVAFLLGLLLGRRDRFQWVLAGVLGVCVLSSLPTLITLFQLRFSNEVAGGSDQFRTEQAVALREFFLDAPLLGHGFGSYSNQVIRETDDDVTMTFSYEKQLFALCGQIGLVGMTLLALMVLLYYSDLWWKSRLRIVDRMGISILVLSWLAAGLYNPLLLHPIAGVNYAAFAMLAALGKEDEEPMEERLSSLPKSLDAATAAI